MCAIIKKYVVAAFIIIICYMKSTYYHKLEYFIVLLCGKLLNKVKIVG